MVETYLEKLRKIDKEISELEKLKETIKKEMKQEGFFFDEKGQVQTNQQTLGVFWEFSYCDYYVGEKGMYTTEAKGANEITLEAFEKVKELMENKQFEDAGELLLDFIQEDEWIILHTIKRGIVKEKNGVWSWETTDSGSNDWQMNPHSYFEIKETSLDKISEFESYYDEDVAP